MPKFGTSNTQHLIFLILGRVFKSASKVIFSKQVNSIMSQEKFVYNPKTLQYEQHLLTSQQKLWKGFGLFSALSLYTALVIWLAPQDQTLEKAQQQEIKQLRSQYRDLSQELEDISLALENIQARDKGIYRQMLQMQPAEDAAWASKQKVRALKDMSDAELLEATSAKLGAVRSQVAQSATSQDEILAQSKIQEADLQAIPSIRPLRLLEKDIQFMSGFGYRVHPVFKIKKMHTGIDFGAPTGTPIYATGDGKIIRVEEKATGYGKSVVISHGKGYETLYGHMSKIGVKAGQEVKKGQQIGLVGSTGTSTAPHVHYEVIRNGERIDPLPFCTDGLSPDEYKRMVDATKKEGIALEK